MVMFSLERFLESPSLEELDSCRKDDLVMIASHFQISVNKNALKKEIKSVVCNRLVDVECACVAGERYSWGQCGGGYFW